MSGTVMSNELDMIGREIGMWVAAADAVMVGMATVVMVEMVTAVMIETLIVALVMTVIVISGQTAEGSIWAGSSTRIASKDWMSWSGACAMVLTCNNGNMLISPIRIGRSSTSVVIRWQSSPNTAVKL